jgi:hypothetical protein
VRCCCCCAHGYATFTNGYMYDVAPAITVSRTVETEGAMTGRSYARTTPNWDGRRHLVEAGHGYHRSKARAVRKASRAQCSGEVSSSSRWRASASARPRPRRCGARHVRLREKRGRLLFCGRCRRSGRPYRSCWSKHPHRRRLRTLHLGHDNPRLCRCWLHGVSTQVETNI